MLWLDFKVPIPDCFFKDLFSPHRIVCVINSLFILSTIGGYLLRQILTEVGFSSKTFEVKACSKINIGDRVAWS